MSEERAVVVQEYDLTGTALEHYGSRSVARELMRRLMLLHPSAKEVGEEGMLAAAQLAIVVGANPMPATNEIHIWEQSGKIQIDLGINFFRRRANELGGIYWVDDPRIMTDNERDQYGVDNKQIGAIAKGCRWDKIKEFMDAGVPWDAAIKGSTRIGIGVVDANAKAKQGRPISWTALKAAEKDLCRALFPNFEQPPREENWLQVIPSGTDTSKYKSAVEKENAAKMQERQKEIEGEWREMTPEEQQAKAKKNSQLLYGDEDFEGFDTPPEAEVEPEPVMVMSLQEALAVPLHARSSKLEIEAGEPLSRVVEKDGKDLIEYLTHSSSYTEQNDDVLRIQKAAQTIHDQWDAAVGLCHEVEAEDVEGGDAEDQAPLF